MPPIAATSEGPIMVSIDWLVGGDPLRVLATILVAVILQILSRRLIHRTVRGMIARAEAKNALQVDDASITPEQRATRTAQRAAAVGTLLISVVSLVIWLNALLVILQILGVNITPLLASAGVVGVALGFGAQTLVKDYLSGIFLIIEDQYGVGDVVQFDAVIGTVEEVALRTTRVRDFTGVIWYLRNGEILNVANRSQGWSLAIVDIPVAANTDFSIVRATVDAVGKELVVDPELGPKVLGEPVFVGIEIVAGDALLVRITERTVPEHQLPIQRALRERVVAALCAAGVSIPEGVSLADVMMSQPSVGRR